VGSEVVGEIEGDMVRSALVGESEGDIVGSDEKVGDVDGDGETGRPDHTRSSTLDADYIPVLEG